jgi:hypothetical protein
MQSALAGSKTVLIYTRNEAPRTRTGLNGHRNVIPMGDHGGGQPQVYEELAKKLDGALSGGARHVSRQGQHMGAIGQQLADRFVS